MHNTRPANDQPGMCIMSFGIEVQSRRCYRAGFDRRDLMMRAMLVAMVVLLRVTVFVWVGIEFADAILRAKVERPAFMLALGERLL